MDIELNTLRIAVTLISLLLFLALMVHSWSRRRAPEYAAAAMLPFAGEELDGLPQPTQASPGEMK